MSDNQDPGDEDVAAQAIADSFLRWIDEGAANARPLTPQEDAALDRLFAMMKPYFETAVQRAVDRGILIRAAASHDENIR